MINVDMLVASGFHAVVIVILGLKTTLITPIIYVYRHFYPFVCRKMLPRESWCQESGL
jgi:hypothetical protein